MYEKNYKASILETIREAIAVNPPKSLLQKLEMVEIELMKDDLQNVNTLKKAR